MRKSHPVSAFTRARKVSRFTASRTALVVTAITPSTSRSSTNSRNMRMALIARWMAAARSTLVRPIPSRRRTTSRISSFRRK
ncbi:MAG TPA: hypothetical protein EYP25_07970 [Anaerolineae bacterium]|nr:hypothetical protein [Anaerolineae bacterium]